MPEYVFDEAFEHRLERTLREMGNEAVRPFDPYETTQLVVTNSRIGGVPITQVPTPHSPAPPPLYPPPLYPPPMAPPRYYDDDEEPAESRRWPLLAALALLIAALVFTGFATGFINLPSNLGITVGSPEPVSSPTPVATGSPEASSAPERTRRPRRSRRPTTTAAPTQLQVTAAPTDAPTPAPTVEPAPTTAPTQLVLPTSDPAIEPSTEPSNAAI